MKSNKLKWTLSILVLAGMTLPALADESTGWYFGAGLGQSRATIEEDEIRADLLTSGFGVSAFDDEERDFAYKLYTGYQFHRNLAMELGYFDLGEFGYSATTSPAGTLDANLEFDGWNLDLVGIAPISERASLFARIGAHHSQTNVDFTATGAVNVLQPRFSERNTKMKAGLGFQYQLSDALGLRLEAERYRMDDAVGNRGELDLISLGLVYHFGQGAPAPRKETPAAPPAPAVVVVPLPVATEEYCSLLDIQFEVDQDEIQLAEQEKLGVLATFLKAYPNTSAVIEGHTDNVGSPSRNLRLSQRRAESVVDYLVSQHGIDRSRLVAIGYGERRPIADNQTEEGARANRRIGAIIGCATDIAGLQPLPARITLAMLIEFDTDDATIKPQYHDQLGKVARYLNANPTITATMEGHTDNASPDVAQKVSRQRAQSVADYLVNRFGVDRSRLNVEGFGGTRRFSYNTSAEARQDNRRVNIILSYPD